ncbi:MAG: isoleucine--tRNA ligase, partial [Candidatus Diapherotrites archaeon]|nr:isoleucine--tRNA ligase [Candidatus Diapherotrites archaeon]
FWKKNKIIEKVRHRNSNSKKKFYFMDGPPYATGHIHMGTALNKILKDVAIRSKRMQGYNVFDRPGYDCHGLPIENKVEKELGFKSKADIEKFGIKNFVERCREFATKYIDAMNNEFLDLGVWMDWQNPYLTLSNEYIEAIWWTFKKADEKGLLYLGSYPVHVCPHCETAVAYNEIEYTKLTDRAIIVKFPSAEEENLFFLIWTTTPWTLPGNTGIMVHPKFDYAIVKLSNNERWVIAKERVEEVMNAIEAGYVIEKVVKGKELEGKRYRNPLEEFINVPAEVKEKGCRIILSERYVNLEEGTGLVHSAPGHGKEDYDAGSKAGLPIISPVAINGLLTEEAGKYSGKKARVVDKEIIADLKAKGFLVYEHDYTHDYPICWRCKTPLLMISLPQWFLKVSALRKKMLKENESVVWVPEWMKERMHNWIESLGDWPVSRNRYWGTPLPIWVCEKCNSYEVIGSIEELKERAKLKKVPDLHKPEIDEIEFKCKKCKSVMKRIPEVLDVWFDSGVSSWAALGFPSEEKLFKEFWPADLNIEGSDQFRGWWNSQLICSLISFGKKPYKAIAVHGMVLDIDKRKMSKSLGNVVQPKEVIEKYGRDFLRYFLIANSRGYDLSFDWNAFNDIRKFFSILLNSFNFAAIYLDLQLNEKEFIAINKKHELLDRKLRAEDLWILSKMNSLAKEIVKHYNSYKFFKIIPSLERFVVEDLSRKYIKLVRPRVKTEAEQLRFVFNNILLSLLTLIAPLLPHFSEFLFRELRSKKAAESIHLVDFLYGNYTDKKLEEEFDKAFEIVEATLSLRDENKLRLRWPLEEIVIVTKTGNEFKNSREAIAKLCNVFAVKEQKEFKDGRGFASKKISNARIYLKTEISPELKDEWELRELIRRIQALRKEKGLVPKEKVEIEISCSDAEFLEKFKGRIENATNSVVAITKSEPKLKLIERAFSIEIKRK